MKSGTEISTWKFPLISRKKYEKKLDELYGTVQRQTLLLVELKKQLRTRNDKGQFEKRAK